MKDCPYCLYAFLPEQLPDTTNRWLATECMNCRALSFVRLVLDDDGVHCHMVIRETDRMIRG